MKQKFLLKTMLLLFALIVGSGTMWADEVTYTFTSKSWGDTDNTWTSGKDGNQYTSGRGVQITSGVTGANATTKNDFANVSKIVVTYSTNASKGAGNVSIQVGANEATSKNVTKTGGTTDRTLEYTYNSPQSGAVKITVTCTENSIYIKSIAVTYTTGGGDTPTTYSVTYDANGATSGDVPTDNAEYEEGDKVTVLGNTGSLAKTGCEFAGWNTQADGEGVDYDEDETFEIAANTTLYALWIPYTITAVSNNESYGTVSLNGSVIIATPAAGYTYASPAYTVSPENSATIAQDGNTFTVTPTADTEVTINFETLPTYTVTFGDGGSVTQASYGAEVTLPSRDAISSYTFAGWSETNVAEETTTAPTIIPVGSYTPTANITLYPVYSKTEGGGGIVNKTASVNIASYATANDWSNSIQYETVTLDENVTATANGSSNTGKYYTNGNEWRFYQGENAYLVIETTSGTLTSATITYNISNTGQLTYEETVVNSGSEIDLSGTSACFWVENSGTATNGQVKITAIEVNYSTSGGGTTYYWSAPVAATVERPTITPKDNPFTFSTDVEITCETDDATIYYTLDGTDPTDASTLYSEAFEITSACTIKAIAIKGSDESSIATLEVTKNLAENTITVIGGTSQTIDLGQGEDQLEITATATNDATVTFTIDNENTTLTEDDDFLLEGNIIEIYSDNLGVIVLKANAAGDDDYAAATEVTITITVDNSMLPGRAGNPYTVAQARAAIDAGTGITDVYATGIVSQAGTVNGSGQISYYISADGLTTSDQLQAYKGKGIAGANFENDDDIQVGDVVIIYGNLKKYNTTYEFDQNNQLVSLVRKIDSDLAISSDATVNLTITSAEMHPTSTITYTTSSTGDVIFVSNEEDVAQVSDAGVITALGEGSTTITVMQEADATYKAGEQTITINVTDNRSAVATDINLPAAQKTLTVGDMDDFAPTATIDAGFTGSVTYTYATSDASVVAVAGTTFSAEAAGTATITITATPTGGNAANYKTATQEVEVTVKGATTLALSGNTATPTYPATATITATVGEGYDGTLTVSSNNEAVVTASVVGTTITITPVAVGTATITVTAPETSIFNGEVERTIEVTVNAPAGTNVAPASSEVTYTFDFTDNTDWEFPTDYTTGENTYTKDGKTITLNTPDNSNGYKFNTNILLIGKSGATLTLPAFDKPVTKITTTGVSSASGKVTQNIYVGETAVSTETTSAKDNHEYIIDPEYQAPGTIYTFKVTNGNNSQLSDLTVHMNQTITVTLNASGYATFCSQYPLDFSAAEGYTAWQITDIEGETITFSKITGDIKGGQGILLKGEANATVTLTSANSETEMAENLLFGTTAPTYVAADTYYGLSGKTFKKVNAGTVPAGKALLPASVVDGSSAKEFLTFVFEDDATGIENVNTNVNDNNAVIYNLAGQRISKMQKGINIVNGKKVLK